MRITPVYDATLLQIICRFGEASKDEIKREYLPPPQRGVVYGAEVTFESNLKTLQDMGYITIENDMVRYNLRS